MTTPHEACAEVIRVETRVDEHDRRFEQISHDMETVTKALWGAVEVLRARPQVHPTVTAIIAVLTCMVGVLATFAIRG